MRLKGDILIARDDFINYQSETLFTKNKKYRITRTNYTLNELWVWSDMAFNVPVSLDVRNRKINYIWSLFYAPKEIRKLKLNKINGDN